MSGESFKGNRGWGIDPDAVEYMSAEIRSICDLGVQVGVVVGGGNIWRGAEAENEGMDRTLADLQDALERFQSVPTRTQSAINIQQVAEPYIRRRAIRHLEKSRVVIFAAGIGNPFMTTDTAAALRATEIDATVLLMAKHAVDGVYASDPNIDPSAKRFDFLSYSDAIERRLGVMDTTALSLCMENRIPIIVFDIFSPGSIQRLVQGEKLGSLVAEKQMV